MHTRCLTVSIIALLLGSACSSSDESAMPPSGNPKDASTNDGDASVGSDAPDALVVGDKTDSSAAGQRCDSTHPCPSGFVCEEGVCHKDCAGNARCQGEVCCAAGEVCYLGACTSPGQDCAGSGTETCGVHHCPTGQQCDPSIGKCLPLPANVQCEYKPAATFEPVLLWSWAGSTANPNYRNVITTPSIADLNGDGAADIIVPAVDYLPGGFNNDGGILCALSGLGDCNGHAKELWCTSPSDPHVSMASTAVGDLEGTGSLTIIAGATLLGTAGNAYGIYGYDATGKRIVDFGTDGNGSPVMVLGGVGGPAIADLDGDGKAEVIVGYTVFDSKGHLKWTKPGGVGNVGFGPLTVIADLDGDGKPEIVGGNMAWHGDGTEAWAAGVEARALADGYPGIADFDGDGKPEVVVISAGAVRVFDAQGNRFTTTDAAIAGNGGPPTIADVDGDGHPEIAVAGQNAITLFKVGVLAPHALTQLWTMPSRDYSSNFTGSSVFDFEGDGKAEVIYGDECFARVYDGAGDGKGATTVRFEVPNTSCTGVEYPVVADVSGDGKAEFVVVANDFSGTSSACAPYVTACTTAYPGYAPTHGVGVYRDKQDNWVATRAIWNQHTYHVTNVCDGVDEVCAQGENTIGRAPKKENNSWSFPAADPLNAYRVNAKLQGVLSAPDLVPTEPHADLSGCPGSLKLVVTVTNLGAVGVPAGVPVAFYHVDGTTKTLLTVEHTSVVLLPGGSQTLGYTWAVPQASQGSVINAEFVVDDDGTGKGTVNECKEDNNTAQAQSKCAQVY
jgi:hypothetical protein